MITQKIYMKDNISYILYGTDDLYAYKKILLDRFNKDDVFEYSKEEYSVSVGAEYNPSMHFNKDYLGSAKSNSELFGFDGGLRSKPIPSDINIPPPSAQNPATSYWTSQFNPEMAAKRETSFMNTNLGLTAGNLYDIGNGGNKLGYQFAGAYRNDYIYYEDYKNGNWRKFADKSVNEMDPDGLERIFKEIIRLCVEAEEKK